MKKYMLLVDGKPGVFDGNQIVFAETRYKGAGVKISQMYNSRQAAKKMMRKSREWRGNKNWDTDFSYDSIPIMLEDNH